MRWCCRYSDNNRYRSISGSCCRHCYFVRNRYLCLPVSSVTFLA